MVAWERGAWYLRAANIAAAPNRLISKNYQTPVTDYRSR